MLGRYVLTFLLSTKATLAFGVEAKHDETWLRLLHFDASKGESRIDSEEFFLSPKGKENPEEERQATIAAMRSDQGAFGPENLHAQCAFPARKIYLKKAGIELPERSCPKTEDWLEKLDAKRATLVYASAFSGNPASMFGHLILRLNGTNPTQSHDLLGYGIAFMARIDPEDNPLTYAFRGLTGGYPAFFNNNTYYEIVGTYNNTESRDLWELGLDLSGVELTFMASHVFELMQFATYEYFFLDENCAYQLLALLEVARPGLQLLDYTDFFVLPIEAFKIAARSMSNQNVSLRMSLESQWRWRLDQLSDQERIGYDQLIYSDEYSIQSASTNTMDAALAYLNYQKFKTANNLSDRQAKLLRTTLLARAKQQTPATPLPSATIGRSPLESHNSSRVAFEVAAVDHNVVPAFSYYMGLHDLMMTNNGYESNSSINYLGFKTKWQNDKLLTEDLLLAEVTSLKPFEWSNKRYSYHLSARHTDHFNPSGERLLRATGGLTFGGEDHNISFLAGYWTGFHGEWSRGPAHGPAARMRVQVGIGNEIRFSAQIHNHIDLRDQGVRRIMANGEAAWSLTKDRQIRVEYRAQRYLETTRSLATSFTQHF
jgi:hypothetical protein